MKEKKRLGEMLIEARLIDEMQLNAALGQQRQWGGKLGSKLIEMGFIDERSIVSVLEKQLGVKCEFLEDREIPQKAMNIVKVDIAKKYCIMPFDLDKNILSIAMADPTDVRTLDELSFILGIRIKPVLALESDIKNAIARHYEGVAYTGKIHRAPIGKMSETMQIVRGPSAAQPATQPPEVTQIIQTESSPTSAPEEISEKSTEKKEITSKTVIEALVAILIEKGVITREELLKKLKKS